MILSLVLILLAQPEFDQFAHVEGFTDIEAIATPTGYGLLLVESSDMDENRILACEVLEALENLELSSCGHISLYRISLNAEGYTEVASLATDYPSPPAVVVLVGCCGFLQLDPSILDSEIEDSYCIWGGGDVSGICNLCTRCNP